MLKRPMKMNYKRILFLVFCFLPFFIIAQIDDDIDDSSTEEKSKPTLFQFLSTDSEIPKVVLTTDLKRIIKDKLLRENINAKFEITKGGQKEMWDIELEARGKSRRRICYFPPIKLIFSKKDLKKNKIRKKHNTLKMVSYCKDKSTYENYILREYIAYKMLNILTDYSFNVQLVLVEYRDSSDRIKPVIRHGILIEDTDEVAERLNAKERNKYEFGRDSVDNFQYDVLNLYQYMISNADWKIGALHNMKMIQDKDTEKFYAIPYDFDYSGFVNAEYSVPNPDYRQTHVTERIFFGECRSIEELATARQLFIDKKAKILAVEKHLFTRKEHKRMMKYIKSFYKILESDKKFKKKCLKKRYTG
jgi:hypothetical protein